MCQSLTRSSPRSMPPVAFAVKSTAERPSLTPPIDGEDASSDDGDNLETPLTDTHFAQTAFINGIHSLPPLEHDMQTEAFLHNQYERYTLGNTTFQPKVIQDFAPNLCNSSSNASHWQLSSPPSSPSFQSNAAHLVEKQANRRNLQASAIGAPTPPSSPAVRRHAQNVSLSPSFYRKSPKFLKTSTMSQFSCFIKPKLLRSAASDYVPATLGHAYSKRFPAGHHLVPDFIHSYQLHEELGSGGYGFVMTAKHRFEGYEAAVKFIIKDKVPSHAWALDNHGNRVPMEAKMLSLVRHEGIVKFYDLFEDPLYFYLVQELHGTPWSSAQAKKDQTQSTSRLSVDTNVSSPKHPVGENQALSLTPSTIYQQDYSLSPNSLQLPQATVGAKGTPMRPQYLRRPSHDLFEYIEQSPSKRLVEDDARYVFQQVVDIVDYLDGEGVTHRDIKDENIIVDEHLKVKLIDFGSVVISDPAQPRPYYDLFFGTTAYASSEILQKKPYQAAPAEIWTLGILLSYLITGASPFPTRQHAIDGRIVLDGSSHANVPASCLHLLTRCLEPEPERRADIKEIKAHPWLMGARPPSRRT